MADNDPPSFTTRHRSALGEWERAWQRPSSVLRGLVDGYHGYRQRLSTPATHRGLPSPAVALVLSFGPPQRISASHGRGGTVTVDSFVAGLHDRHVLIEAEEHHGIQVDLGPIGAYRLFGPLRELTGRTVPLDALLGAETARLLDDLACAADWPTRFRRLDRELIRLCAAANPLSPEVGHAWERIVGSGGRVRVATLAAEVGWSPRHLTARFGDQLGLSPKRMASLARFDRVARLLRGCPWPSLAEVAATTGYYDQAHLTNEVRAFSGLAPAQLVSHHLPDGGGVFHPHG